MRHNRPIGPDCGDSALTIYRGGMTLLQAGHQPVTNKTPRFRYLLPSGPDATGKLERIHRCRRDVQQATDNTPPERHPSITLPRRGFGPYLHTMFPQLKITEKSLMVMMGLHSSHYMWAGEA